MTPQPLYQFLKVKTGNSIPRAYHSITLVSKSTIALGSWFLNEISIFTIFGYFGRPMCDPLTTLSAPKVEHQLFQFPFYIIQLRGWASQHFLLISCIFQRNTHFCSFSDLWCAPCVTPWPLSSWKENMWKVLLKSYKMSPISPL